MRLKKLFLFFFGFAFFTFRAMAGEVWIDEIARLVRDHSYQPVPEEFLRSGDINAILAHLDSASRIREVKPSSLDAVRGFVPEGSVQGPVFFRPHIAYFKIRSFGRRTAFDLYHALTAVSQRRLSGLILDLRGNRGGFLSSAKACMEFWIPAGQAYLTLTTRGGEKQTSVSSNPDPLQIPTVLLVNGRTASCAEAFAAVLKASKKAELVGMPTYGKQSVQEVFPLDSRHVLFLTTAHYRVPGAEEAGTVPNMRVEEEEEQLKMALKLLQ